MIIIQLCYNYIHSFSNSLLIKDPTIRRHERNISHKGNAFPCSPLFSLSISCSPWRHGQISILAAPVRMQSSYSDTRRGKRIPSDIIININIINNKITIIVIIVMWRGLHVIYKTGYGLIDTLSTHSLGLHAKLYRWSTHLTVYRYTRNRVLNLH